MILIKYHCGGVDDETHEAEIVKLEYEYLTPGKRVYRCRCVSYYVIDLDMGKVKTQYLDEPDQWCIFTSGSNEDFDDPVSALNWRLFDKRKGESKRLKFNIVVPTIEDFIISGLPI